MRVKRTFFVGLNRAANAIVRRLGLSRFRGGDLLYLTTTGHKSGKVRTVPLLFVRDGDDLVVAASNGGADWQPGWWLNLQARPEGVVRVAGQEQRVTATEADGPERDVLWARLMDQNDAYDGYQEKVRRRIAVVRLTPLAG